ncbi:hypothetical protein SynROS8604_01993 [Synechococcus sp. ROS8604]|nr:hypothetical protein SynROS8604_01993 [Synechococcus sp. ROS8604]
MNQRWQNTQRHEADVHFFQFMNRFLIHLFPSLCSASFSESISKPLDKQLQCSITE